MNIGNQLIPYQTADTTVDEVYYRNAGRTRNAGFEIFLSYKSFDFLSFQGSYAANNYLFLDYAIESGNDIYQLKKNQVPGLPARRGFIGIKYTPVKGLTSELNFQQTDSYFANDFNGPVTSGSANKRDFINEGFTQLDFRLSYERQIGRSKPLIFGGINNILNQTYNSSVVVNAAGNRFFEPSPGINFYAGITLPLSVIK